MRLLFLSNFYPPFDRGGLENLCREVADALQQRGHIVDVLTSRFGVSPDEIEPPAGGVMRCLHLQADIFHYRPADFFLKRAAQERANMQALREAIDRCAPDLVVVWGMWNLSRNLPFQAERWLPGRVAYYISDTGPATEDIHVQYWALGAERRISEWLKAPLRALAMRQLRREHYPPALQFQNAVCCSHYIRDLLVADGKVPATTDVLYHGIDPAQFLDVASRRTETGSDTLRLLYFGRLVHDKGVHTAVEALGKLKEKGLDARIELTIVGSGHPDYEAWLRTLSAELGVTERVQFAGRVPWDELLVHLERADAVLFTSIGPEALARTVMEAMAAGVLIIGTPAGGQREMLVDGENALVFGIGDPASLADRVAYALDAPAERRRLAQAGQQTVLERFTLDRMADDMETWLTQVAA